MEKYKTVKVRLKDIVVDKNNLETINDLVQRMNILTTHLYQCMRLWVLTFFDPADIPNINVTLLSKCFKSLVKPSNLGRKVAAKNLEKLNIFQKFYTETYSKLGYTDRISGLHLSQVAKYSYTQMVTAIENNIKVHYINRVKSFVNRYFDPAINEECDKIKDPKIRAAIKKERRKETYLVKQDIFNNTRESPEKYHKWIDEQLPLIIPEKFNIDKLYDKPQKFLKYLVYMSRKLERDGKKSFQFFPLRSSFVPSHITIDTAILTELFPKYEDERSNIMKNRRAKWTDLLESTEKLTKKKDIEKQLQYKTKMEKFLFGHKNKQFCYEITTNGYDASIKFLTPEDLKSKDIKSGKKLKVREEIKDLTDEQKEERQAEIEEAERIKKQTKKNEKKNKPKEPVIREFPYLEDVSDHELEHFEETNTGEIDMGKNQILTILNRKTRKIFKYTKGQHIHDTQRLILRHKRNKLRNKLRITKLEEAFTKKINDKKICSKSCDIKKFEKYIKYRNKLLLKITTKYEQQRFRQLRFHAYINKTRARDKLVKNVKTFLGDNSKLVIGNWSANKNLKHTEPVPGIGLKRHLAKQFKVYDIDEFRTSVVHNKTDQRCDNLYVKGKKIHSILTFQMENQRLGCIHRDRNAVLNMDRIISRILEDKTYPTIFQRSTTLPTRPILDGAKRGKRNTPVTTGVPLRGA